MFKRLFWFSSGIAVGTGASWWTTRKIRRAAERYLPDRLAAEAAEAAKQAAVGVRSAVAEGRDAMREREAALQARFDPDRRTAPGAPQSIGPGPGATSSSSLSRTGDTTPAAGEPGALAIEVADDAAPEARRRVRLGSGGRRQRRNEA